MQNKYYFEVPFTEITTQELYLFESIEIDGDERVVAIPCGVGNNDEVLKLLLQAKHPRHIPYTEIESIDYANKRINLK